MERHFGVALVNRNDRPIKATEAGEILVQYSEEIFGKIDEMERRVAEIRDAKAGKIVIGASTSVGSYLLPDLVALFKRKYPYVEITARIIPRALVYDDIKANRTDFAFVLALAAPDNLTFKSLRGEHLIFVCSPKHPLARKKKVNLASITTERFVTAGQSSDYVIMTNEMLKQRGVHKYPLAIELDSMEAVKRSVGLNMGIAFLPLLGVEKEIRNCEICRIQLERQVFQCTLALVYRPTKFFTPTMTNFVDFCRKVLMGGSTAFPFIAAIA